jgi:arylsulfatase A-like enzyme
MRILAGMISAVDDWVGAVLATLKEHGLEENSLVFFTSDTGAVVTSDPDGARNKPFIGHKRNLYEGGIRVPYVMQWKGQFSAGQSFEAPVSSMDIFPTALAAAGVTDLSPYKLDGVDLVPFLKKEKPGSPHEYLFWRSGPNSAVRKGPWKLLMFENGLTRLYNLAEDPAESIDRSSEKKGVVDEMKQAFQQWTEDKGKPRESQRQIKTRYNGDVIDWHI